MAYSGNREQDDEQQALLQQQLGGAPVNTTMPVGQPSPVDAGGAAAGGGLPSRDQRDQLKYARPAAGFNDGDYGGDVKARTSMKNTFAKGVQAFDQTPESFTPEEAAQFSQSEFFKTHFPGASFDGKDKFNFGGMLSDFETGTPVYEVDAIGNAAPGQGTLSWQDLVNDGGGQAAQGGGMDPLALLGGQGNSLDELGQSDVLAQILQELQGAQGGGDEGQALLQSLMGGQ